MFGPSKKLRSHVVYKVLYIQCNVTYCGKTMPPLKVRAMEPMNMSIDWKITNSQQSTAVQDHLFFCSHLVSFDDFSISARNNFELELKESLLIHRDEPSYSLNAGG